MRCPFVDDRIEDNERPSCSSSYVSQRLYPARARFPFKGILTFTLLIRPFSDDCRKQYTWSIDPLSPSSMRRPPPLANTSRHRSRGRGWPSVRPIETPNHFSCTPTRLQCDARWQKHALFGPPGVPLAVIDLTPLSPRYVKVHCTGPCTPTRRFARYAINRSYVPYF
jgi:hypothetical protein